MLAAVAWVLLGSKLLVVRHVEVSGTHLAPRDRVVAAARITLGLPMVRLDTAAVRDRVQGVREVESARVERVWPGTVRIEVRERVPLVAVERSGRFHQLDRFAMTVVDSARRPASLPLLTVAAPGPDDPATTAALQVVGELPAELSRRLTAVDAPSPESVTLRLGGARPGGADGDPLTVVWGAPGRAAEKARLVDALRRSAAGRAAGTIDVSSPEVVTTR
ncbi:cell division protein FtsQ [Thermomonospora echinospora]|uniref:Cell division protein FtsQ n=1 Tax=Thermomonospora echinospora TaxID=1992 RepID=A0A1H5SNX6_9ACTN|nr:cell division protein FtsQ [Thermomonospora echinospora]